MIATIFGQAWGTEGVSERQTEGGVGPAVSIEDPAWDSFHVTGDGVCHQLDRSDQQTAR